MTLSHIQALCVSNVPVTTFEDGSGSSSQQFDALTSSPYEDAAARARIFYYAYAQEGIVTGMRGGRFFLCVLICLFLVPPLRRLTWLLYYYDDRDNDDLDAFQRGLPADSYGGVGAYLNVFQILEIFSIDCCYRPDIISLYRPECFPNLLSTLSSASLIDIRPSPLPPSFSFLFLVDAHTASHWRHMPPYSLHAHWP
jgi:hypothetical protein